MAELLAALFTALIAFTACHYFLKQMWSSAVGCAIVSGVFAVLYLVLVGSTRL